MKKYLILALALVLTLFALTGCRSKQPETTTTAPTTMAPTTAAPTTRPTTAPTTAATTQPTTQATTGDTMPGIDDMIPGTDDTIDPSNGANQSTDSPRSRMLPRG